MPCYKPLQGWQLREPNEKGKYPVVFTEPADGIPVELPCGNCIGCRLERSKQWAMRIMHETQLHDECSFITLTYNDENLPKDWQLTKRDWQLFLKKFRKALHPKRIRFYMAGEYGEDNIPPKKFGRPHFHAIIFGWYPDKDDISPVKKTASGEILYHSDFLSKIWGKGFVSVGQVTFQSAGYVARYVTKKINGDLKEDHYKEVDITTGELIDFQEEFSLSSRRPGIGGDWYKKYKKDLRKGFITMNGVKMKATKYYDYLMDKDNPLMLEDIKQLRILKALEEAEDNTDERLKVKEKIKRKKLKLLPRGNIKND